MPNTEFQNKALESVLNEVLETKLSTRTLMTIDNSPRRRARHAQASQPLCLYRICGHRGRG